MVSALINIGGIISKSTAQKRWSKEKFAANKSQRDEAPKFRNPSHKKIYNPDSGSSPDDSTPSPPLCLLAAINAAMWVSKTKVGSTRPQR